MAAEESHVSMISGGREPESSKTPQYLVTAAVALVTISAGTVIGWSSPALAEMRAPNATMPITAEEASWVGSLMAIGAFVGALPAGTMVDLIGRKWTIMSLSLPLIASWTMIHLANSVNTIYVARLLGGLSIGAVSAAVPVYIVEIADDSIRGRLGSTFQLSMVLGNCYTLVMGAIVPYTSLPLYCGIVNILFVVLFFFAPESPVYLIKNGRMQDAENALQLLRGRKYNIHRELQSMEKEVAMQAAEKVPFLQEITKKISILSMATCLTLMLFQQLSGINIVVFYTESIFTDAGSSLDPSISSILAGLAQTLSTFFAAWLIDRSGRRILLQVSSSVMSLCLAVLGYYFHLKTRGDDVAHLGSLPVVAVIVFITMYGIGYGPIPWLMSGEILPPEIKGPGLGMAAAFKWLLAFVITKSFHPLTISVGPAVTYWMLSFAGVISFLFTTFVIIETKGKSLAQVQRELKGKKKTKKSKANNLV